jgi:5-methylcytosine-specific restriction endonuclease McrA
MCKDCKECKLLYKPFKRRNKKKAVPFKELKKEVFKRDGWRCQICGTEDDLTVHHLKEGDVLENLITVCKQCHSDLHKRGEDKPPLE